MTIIESKLVKTKSEKSLTLRSAVPEEAQLLSVYLKQMLTESYQNLNSPKNYYDDVDISVHEVNISKKNQDANQFLLFAFCENRIVAAFSLKADVPAALQHCASFGMTVLKEFQGDGLGKLILEYGLQCAAALGRRNIRLQVRTFNKVAIALYESVGFRCVGVLKKIALVDGTNFDEFVYQRVQTTLVAKEKYSVVYSDPLSISRLETVNYERKETEWPGWLWCVNKQNIGGWVHESFLILDFPNATRGEAVVKRAYTARELGVENGEKLESFFSEGEWHWCQNSLGHEGWVPENVLDV